VTSAVPYGMKNIYRLIVYFLQYGK
jgi:hypothetical protein